MPPEQRKKGRRFFEASPSFVVPLICGSLIASPILPFRIVRKLSITLFLKIKTIEVHNLRPRSYEVTHELLLRVVLCVNLSKRSELGVRAKDQVDGGACPLLRAGGAITPLVHVRIRGGCLPLCTHVQQIHEEVVRQRPRMFGEDTISRVPGVSIQGA